MFRTPQIVHELDLQYFSSQGFSDSKVGSWVSYSTLPVLLGTNLLSKKVNLIQICHRF